MTCVTCISKRGICDQCKATDGRTGNCPECDMENGILCAVHQVEPDLVVEDNMDVENFQAFQAAKSRICSAPSRSGLDAAFPPSKNSSNVSEGKETATAKTGGSSDPVLAAIEAISKKMDTMSIKQDAVEEKLKSVVVKSDLDAMKTDFSRELKYRWLQRSIQ